MNFNDRLKTGITSYGAYIPKYRITADEISSNWGNDAAAYKSGLGLVEKSVPGLDEDTVSISANAAIQAKDRLNINLKIGAIYSGSESHPYAVKPTSTIVSQALELDSNFTAADVEFACKAGTAAMQMVLGLVESDIIAAGVAIGADTAQGSPGDALEYSAGCGAAAFILSKEKIIAKILHTTSVTSDTPDFWRRIHEHFPKHGGRFTGEPAYFKHIISAAKLYLEQTNTKISDYEHVVFHMPNGKFPVAAAKIIGATKEQMEHGLIVKYVGNLYSACSLVGLCNVLDHAKSGEKILLVSYGSGAGSDAIGFEVTKEIENYRTNNIKLLAYDQNVMDQIDNKKYLSYGQYLRHARKLIY
jgi:hydroxymethylglutaryl-CoA synthase